MRLKKIADCKYTLEELVAEPKALDEVRHHLLKGTAFRIPHSISIFKLKEFKNKLNENFDLIDDTYTARVKNVKNYRQRHWDHTNQVVPAKFISWSYFPWNKESKPLFNTLINLFILRNLLANLDKFKYLNGDDSEATARLAFQFYPKGEGYMHEHQDPQSKHQLALPTLLLSDYGLDYNLGGFYALDENNEKVIFDKTLKFGDLTLFHPSIPHGVAPIDPDELIDDCKSINEGRLMMIAGVNNYAGVEGKYKANISNASKI